VAISSGSWRGMLGRCGGLPYANAGLPRRADALLAMTRCGANGRGGSSQFSDAWPSAVIARKVSKRTDVAIQSEALHGMPGRCGGCRTRSAGLPRRYAPRNDNAKTWGMLKRPPDCRVAALLAMTTGRTGMGEVGSVPVFGRIPCAVIASPVGRGNQVSSLLCHCEEGLEEN
jgi:hypothetical protein